MKERITPLISAVRDAVISEYLTPRGITPEEFIWPGRNSTAWRYCGELAAKYMGNQFLNTDHEVNPDFIPDSPDKEIIDAVFHGFITWFETHYENNYDNYAASIAALQPYNQAIPAIDLTSPPTTDKKTDACRIHSS